VGIYGIGYRHMKKPRLSEVVEQHEDHDEAAERIDALQAEAALPNTTRRMDTPWD